MTDIRVCNTGTLLRLNRQAIKHDLNRTLDHKALTKALDPEGNHILSIVLWGHNVDSAPELHHRVQVLAKVNGSEAPTTTILDVLDADWKRLTTLDAVVADAAS